MINLIRNTINEFCQAFVENPYMCYTEHVILIQPYQKSCQKLGLTPDAIISMLDSL